MAIEIMDFPMNSMVDLSIAMLNYQRASSNPLRISSENLFKNHLLIFVPCPVWLNMEHLLNSLSWSYI